MPSVVVHGRLSMSCWEAEGQRRTKLGVVANQVLGEFAYRTVEETTRPDPEVFNAELDAAVAQKEKAVA